MHIGINLKTEVLLRRMTMLAGVAAIATISIGMIAVIGWIFDIPTFRSVFPGFVIMRANTALGLIACGTALLLLRREAASELQKRTGQVLAGIAVLLGLLTLSETVFGWNIGIDEALFQDTFTAPELHPGRVSPVGATCFVLLGLALLLLGRIPGQFLSLGCTFLVLLTIIGYVSDVESLYRIEGYSSIAPHTAFTFLILSLGILAVRPDRGIMNIITSDTPSGRTLRIVLPMGIVFPIILGWLVERAGALWHLNSTSTTSILITLLILLYAVLLYANAATLSRAEVILRESEERYRTLFETMDQGFCVVEMIYDANGKAVDYRFTEINPAFEKHTGLHNAIGVTIRQMVPNHDAHWFEIYGNVAETGESIQFENPADAMQRYYDVFAFRVGGEGSRKVGILFTDITARKKSDKEIERLNNELHQRVIDLQLSNRELESFSYSVSHDLRAPLRGIDGYTRILIETYEELLDVEGKRICGIISSEAQRMGKLLDGLLMFSRFGRQEIQTSVIDMKALIVQIFNELTRFDTREHLDFRIGELPPTLGDALLVRQMWVNLLSNAIKFSSKREKPVIEIGATQSENETTYFIRDNGAGFDMRYADKLFGVFQRLHSEREFEGTGAGLAITHRIVQRHSGRIWSESEVDKGTVFYVSLPNNGESK